MLNWNNTTLNIVRAFKNFHATRLPILISFADGAPLNPGGKDAVTMWILA